MYYKKGFSLIEILLALAVSVIVFVGVFQFAASIYVQSKEMRDDIKYFSYQYGEKHCPMQKEIEDLVYNAQDYINLSNILSTSTKVTSMHYIQEDKYLITTNSASTSEGDIFIISLDFKQRKVHILHALDAGPGIQDSKLLDNYLYIANTSVNSHIKVFHINVNATGTEAFTEISNIKIPSLAASISLPKRLSVHSDQLILGSEKSNTGPELFSFSIDEQGKIYSVTKTLELNGQLNQSLTSYGELYIANAADPELRVHSKDFIEIFTYDAPLTLGNGKSVLYEYPYIILGRTLGSGELSLLMQRGTTTEVLEVKRTNGTVDFLQKIDNQNFLAITSNEDKELQFWEMDKLAHRKDINIPGRVSAYACQEGNILLATIINAQPTIVWLNM